MTLCTLHSGAHARQLCRQSSLRTTDASGTSHASVDGQVFRTQCYCVSFCCWAGKASSLTATARLEFVLRIDWAEVHKALRSIARRCHSTPRVETRESRFTFGAMAADSTTVVALKGWTCVRSRKRSQAAKPACGITHDGAPSGRFVAESASMADTAFMNVPAKWLRGSHPANSFGGRALPWGCLLYTSPSPRDRG